MTQASSRPQHLIISSPSTVRSDVSSVRYVHRWNVLLWMLQGLLQQREGHVGNHLDVEMYMRMINMISMRCSGMHPCCHAPSTSPAISPLPSPPLASHSPSSASSSVVFHMMVAKKHTSSSEHHILHTYPSTCPYVRICHVSHAHMCADLIFRLPIASPRILILCMPS